MDDFVTKYLLDLLILIAGGVVAYAVRKHDNDIRQIEKTAESAKEKANACELNLAHYRTHTSENYCDKITMQETLKRLHDRIDDIFDVLLEKKK